VGLAACDAWSNQSIPQNNSGEYSSAVCRRVTPTLRRNQRAGGEPTLRRSERTLGSERRV
jgi:hypothetical protein